MLHRSTRGAALIIVLWLIVLLTLIATAVSSISVSHRRTASQYAQSIASDEAMDSALRLVLLRMITSPLHQQALALSSQSMVLFDKTLTVTLERESGRIDLNSAPQELLFAALAANGWSEAEARSMAARIADWRDSDDAPEPFGAELPVYRGANLHYGPRNAPFETVGELRQVIGGEKIDSMIMDAFTVYTHAEMPNVTSALPQVLKALQWGDRQHLGDHGWLSSMADLTSSQEPKEANTIHFHEGEPLRLRACITSPITTTCRIAVVRLTGNERRPLQVFVWKSVIREAG